MLNRVVLIGRLTKDPELRYTQSGVAVVSFTLAVDRYRTASGEREVDFISVQAWRQLAEHCANYLSKGKMAAVDGSLEIRPYTDKDGQKRQDVHVRADSVKFLSPKDSNAAAPARIQEEQRPFAPEDDDLPF